MQAYIVWFVAAAVLIAAELLSGTFYLLVIGVGVAAGGLSEENLGSTISYAIYLGGS